MRHIWGKIECDEDSDKSLIRVLPVDITLFMPYSEIRSILGREEVMEMARFISLHTIPLTEDVLKAAAKGKPPKGVTWKMTYCDFADNKFVCDWEAPNKEEVEIELKARKVPFDVVYPVQIFNVAKAKLES